MAGFERFSLRSPDDLNQKLNELNLFLPQSQNTDILAQPLKTDHFTLPNRFVVQPMEGVDAIPETSAPSELTFRRYRRFAAGGAALIWFEAAAVTQDGKSNPRQLMLTRNNLDIWKKLTHETRQSAAEQFGHDIVLVLQLTHSGRWSKPEGRPRPVLVQHNPAVDRIQGLGDDYPLISDGELERMQQLYTDSAVMAFEAGFDGVEMKAVHGYLAGEMLGAHKRSGKYGGPYQNRTRFVRECMSAMEARAAKNQFVTARLTMHEPSAFPYGWGVSPKEGSTDIDLTEPLTLAKEMTELFRMPLFNYSIGYPRLLPYLNRPFNNPVSGGRAAPEHPLEGIHRFLTIGKTLQSELGGLPVVTAAMAWLRDLFPVVAAGLLEQGWAKLIGQGRGSFAYPDSVKDIIETGRMQRDKCCIACSLCSRIMKDGAGRNGCPVRDGSVYKAELQKGREAARSPQSAK